MVLKTEQKFLDPNKFRVKGKGETTAELAQSVRKLTRQAYPKVSLKVIEALALDYFIDTIPETEIRMRLCEVGPTTLAEAEKIAVRMEPYSIAGKQRTRLVGKAEKDSQNTPSTVKILKIGTPKKSP
ncbi:MAG: hypothetical protein AB2693_29530 [Candidatus Thiodiazotropha sp.]